MASKIAVCWSSAPASTARALRIYRPPISLLPFLYPSSVTLRPVTARAPPARTSSTKSSSSHPRRHVADARINATADTYSADIPFEQSTLENIHDYDSQASPSTMTDIEKEAFSRLFDTLAPTPQNPIQQPPSDKDIKSHQRKRPDAPSDMATLEQEIRNTSLDDHESSAVLGADYDIAHIYGEQLLPEAVARVNRFPSAIRKHAKRAIILHAMEQNRKDSQDPIAIKAHAEMRRVEALLLACETDKQLRDVMQKEVFNEAKLVLREAGTAKNKKSKPKPIDYAEKYLSADEMKLPKHKQSATIRYRMRQAGEKLQPVPEEPSLSESENNERVQLLAHTYAPLLLLAVRLLLKYHPASDMALALLEAARSLGPTSYTLAASTPLYNALLKQSWQMSMKYSRIIPLLQEMEDAGLSMNHDTLKVVEDVSEYRQRARWGWWGAAIKVLEEGRTRSAEGDQIDTWRHKILKSIHEAEIGRGRRAQTHSKLHTGETADGRGQDASKEAPVMAAAA